MKIINKGRSPSRFEKAFVVILNLNKGDVKAFEMKEFC